MTRRRFSVSSVASNITRTGGANAATGSAPSGATAISGGIALLVGGFLMDRLSADYSGLFDLLEKHRIEVALDTGFIVHNQRTYPTLLRLFSELGIRTQESDMSFGVRCEGCGLEYAGARGARGLLAVRPNPRYLRMLGEVLRFHRSARAALAGSSFRCTT